MGRNFRPALASTISFETIVSASALLNSLCKFSLVLYLACGANRKVHMFEVLIWARFSVVTLVKILMVKTYSFSFHASSLNSQNLETLDRWHLKNITA